jgi:hypothetical protein
MLRLKAEVGQMSANRNTERREKRALTPDVIADLVPRTELGRTLAALRAEIVAAGEQMLDDEGLEREIAERRGGFYRGLKDE